MPNNKRLMESFQKDNSGQKILVNSGAKAGTTWVRTMICSLPDYEPVIIRKKHTPNMLETLQTHQVWHGHFGYSTRLMDVLKDNNIRTVFVYRDLRDTIISNYFHIRELNPKRAPEGFFEKDMSQLLEPAVLPTWCAPVSHFKLLPYWLAERHIVKVRFEDLIENPVDEMSRVFLGLGLNTSRELVELIVEECSFERQSGRLPGDEVSDAPLRKGIVGDWKNYFSTDLAKRFDATYGHLLKIGGYQPSSQSSRATPASDNFKTLQTILQEPIPKTLSFKKSDCTKRELTLLYRLAKHAYRGKGAIIDLGCGKGGSTHAFCSGLSENPQNKNKTKRIVAIDCFEFGDACHGRHCTLADFRGAIEGYDAHVDICPGDFMDFEWKGGDVEILFVDIAKTLDLFRHTVRNFYGNLVPGESTILHQDFGRPRLPWLHYTTMAMRSCFNEIEIVDDTFYAKVCKKIDRNLIRKMIRDEFSISEKIALVMKAKEEFGKYESYGCSYDEILKLSVAHIHHYAGDRESAIKVVDDTKWSAHFRDRFDVMFQQIVG